MSLSNSRRREAAAFGGMSEMTWRRLWVVWSRVDFLPALTSGGCMQYQL